MFLLIPKSFRDIKGKLERLLAAANEAIDKGTSYLESFFVEMLEVRHVALDTVDRQTRDTETEWRFINRECRDAYDTLIRLIRDLRQTLIRGIRRGIYDATILEVFDLVKLPRRASKDVWRTRAADIAAGLLRAQEQGLPEVANPSPEEVLAALESANACDRKTEQVALEMKRLQAVRRKEMKQAVSVLRTVARRFREVLSDQEETVVREIMRLYGFVFEGDRQVPAVEANPAEGSAPVPAGDPEETATPATNPAS